MSSWNIYGYGIKVSDIETESVEQLEKLLDMVPKYHAKIKEWFAECEIDKPTYSDYLDADIKYSLGLASILKNVILEAEGIEFTACEDYDCNQYLVFEPTYPWDTWNNRGKCPLTEELIREILSKYVSVLSNEEIEVNYRSVANGD